MQNRHTNRKAKDDRLNRRVACETIREPDTDILVKSAEVVTPQISITVTISNSVSRDGLADRVKASVTDLLKLRGRREFNELTHADIIHKIKSDVHVVRNVTVHRHLLFYTQHWAMLRN